MSNSTSTETQSGLETSELSLLDQVMQETRIQPGDDGFDTARRGVEAFITDLLSNQQKIDKVEKKLKDERIHKFLSKV